MKAQIVITLEGTHIDVKAPIVDKDLCYMLLAKAMVAIVGANSAQGLMLANQLDRLPGTAPH